MKVNKIFHWLYFLMLLLPIFSIPMYAIYVRNENATFAQEITVQENEVVDFNQLVQNGNFANGTDYWSFSNGIEYSISDNVLTFKVNSGTSNSIYQSVSTIGHKYLLSADVKTTTETNDIDLFAWSGYRSIRTSLTTNWQHLANVFEKLDTYDGFNGVGLRDLRTSNWDNVQVTNIMFIDLTQMFGSGNEPTLQQFNNWYPNDYYEYTLSDKQLLKAIDQTTYNDTDVGSQFTYTIYNSINKYFNYDKVFNFGYLYDWLQLNFFNGNAPLGFFIFWHYLIYFLLTSLLWLLFDVLMYVPNLIHKWLDKAS